jgi:hypothetical protein
MSTRVRFMLRMFLVSQPLLTFSFAWRLVFAGKQGCGFPLHLFFLPAIRATARQMGSTDTYLFWASIILLYPTLGLLWGILRSTSCKWVRRLSRLVCGLLMVALLADLDMQWGKRTMPLSFLLSAWEVVVLNVAYGLLSAWLLALGSATPCLGENMPLTSGRRGVVRWSRKYRWTVSLSLASCTLLNSIWLLLDSGWGFTIWYTAFLPLALVLHWTGADNFPFYPLPLWAIVWTLSSLFLYAAMGFAIDRFGARPRRRGRAVLYAVSAAAYAVSGVFFHIAGPREFQDYLGSETWQHEGAIIAQVGILLGLVWLAWRELRTGKSHPT